MRDSKSTVTCTGFGHGLKIAKELIRQKLLAQERLIRNSFQNENSTRIIANARQALSEGAIK